MTFDFATGVASISDRMFGRKPMVRTTLEVDRVDIHITERGPSGGINRLIVNAKHNIYLSARISGPILRRIADNWTGLDKNRRQELYDAAALLDVLADEAQNMGQGSFKSALR